MTASALAPTPAYGSPAWLAERRSYIGASDVPAIMGISPFAAPIDVYLQKRGLLTVEDAPHLRWGHYHEAGIAAEYQRAFPDYRLEAVGTLPHPEYPWLRATVDRLVHRPDGVHVLEMKSTSERMGHLWGEPGTDEIPDHVLVQGQVHLMVLQLPFAHAAVLVGHSDLRMPYVIEADPELQEMIVDRCHDFWHRHITGGEEPPITGPHTEQHLRRKYATHTTVVREIEGEEARLLQRFFEVRGERKLLEALEDELKPQILQLIGGDYGVKGAPGKALWTSTKGRTSIDYKGLVAHLNVPDDVIQQFTKLGAPTRSLRCYPTSGDE